MPYSRKKILLLYCGGVELPDSNQKGLTQWLDSFLELKMMADIKPKFIYDGPGSGISRKEWQDIVLNIKENFKKYDGFIITHGLDNLLLSSSLTSYLIQRLGKPVIFTGSPLIENKSKIKKPIKKIFKEYESLGIKANLINAVQVATMDISGVSLMFGNRLLNPVRTIQTFDSNLNIFSSWQVKDLGKIQFGIQLHSSVPKRINVKPKYFTDFNDQIKIIDPGLGLQSNLEISENTKGILIKSFQEDPSSIIKIIKTNLPILVYTQGNFKETNNIISARGYTYEAALAKFMWVLGKTNNIKEIRRAFKKNYLGEIK